MSGTLYDANRMYAQISSRRKIYIYIIYIVHMYNITLYVKYV
jgi:hypothetical protein